MKVPSDNPRLKLWSYVIVLVVYTLYSHIASVVSCTVPVKAGPRWFEGWLMVYNSTPAARFHLSKFEAVSAINLCMHWHCVPCPQYPVYIIIIIPPTLALLWTKQPMDRRLIHLVFFLVHFRPSSSRHNPIFVVRANLINFMCLIYRWRENNLVHTEQIVCGIFRFSFYLKIKILLLDVEAALKATKVLIPV